MSSRRIQVLACVISVVVTSWGCGGGGGGGGIAFKGGNSSTVTHPALGSASFQLDGGDTTGQGGIGYAGAGGDVSFYGTSGVEFGGGAQAMLPAAPRDQTSGGDLVVPSGVTAKFSDVRKQLKAAGLLIDPNKSDSIVRVKGDIQIEGTIEVDIDQAIITSAEGNVYVGGTIEAALPNNVSTTATNANFAVVSELGFVRVGGTLRSLGLLMDPSVAPPATVPGGSILLGGKSVFVVSGALIETSGADAPAGTTPGDGSSAGSVSIGNPTAVLQSMVLPNGNNPQTSTIVSADGGAVLIDDGVTIRMNGGAANTRGVGGYGGLLTVAYAATFTNFYTAFASVPTGDRLTAGLSGHVEANGGAGKGAADFMNSIFAAGGGAGGVRIALSGTCGFAMDVVARGGSAEDDSGGKGGMIDFGAGRGIGSALFDVKITVAGAAPTVSVNGGQAAGGPGPSAPNAFGPPWPGDAGAGGTFYLHAETGALKFKGAISANGGDTGTSVTTAASSGAGGDISFRAGECDITVEGTIAASAGKIKQGTDPSDKAGNGGAVRMFSSNGAVTNHASISVNGGDVEGAGQAGAGGNIGLVVDDNGAATLTLVSGATGAPQSVSVTAYPGVADNISGSLTNTGNLIARGGSVGGTGQGGPGGNGGNVVLDADPNQDNLPVSVTGKNSGQIDVSGGDAGGTVGGPGGSAGGIYEAAPTGFLNDTLQLLRAKGGKSVTGWSASSDTTPLVK